MADVPLSPKAKQALAKLLAASAKAKTAAEKSAQSIKRAQAASAELEKSAEK